MELKKSLQELTLLDRFLFDDATRIFLNTHGTDEENISPELKELLEFMEHTNDEDREFQSEKVRHLKESVQTIQADEEMGVKYMQAWEEKESAPGYISISRRFFVCIDLFLATDSGHCDMIVFDLHDLGRQETGRGFRYG